MNEYKHIPVLLNETIDLLDIKKDGIYVDCTLGGAGHASEILKRIPNGYLYGFDQDTSIKNIQIEKLSKVGQNFTIINSNFVNLEEELKKLNVDKVDGILFDLGVSSFQIDMAERGFSFQNDGPLDMRMNQEQALSAHTIVNEYKESDLIRILFQYGEENNAKLIARKIVASRPINTTLELVDVIKKALPAKILRKEKHPAKKTFQALRIEVNKELIVFDEAIKQAVKMLKVGGRCAVITFHSLEDRICKQYFKSLTTYDLPKDLPFIPDGYKICYKLVTPKGIQATSDEQNQNSRSHSARLRVIERMAL